METKITLIDNAQVSLTTARVNKNTGEIQVNRKWYEKAYVLERDTAIIWCVNRNKCKNDFDADERTATTLLNEGHRKTDIISAFVELFREEVREDTLKRMEGIDKIVREY